MDLERLIDINVSDEELLARFYVAEGH